MKPLSKRTSDLKQSNIRAITLMLEGVDGINLGQGICDMPTPDPIKRGAKEAVDEDRNIYSYYGGIRKLREAVLEKAQTYNGIPASSPDEVMVTVGSTGAFVAAMLTLLDAGDEVIVFEPYYGYHVNLLGIMGVKVRYVRTESPDWSIDFDAVESMVNDRTKAVVVNTPGNPNGKVWSVDELTRMSELLSKHDLWAITDEIYEYMLYDGRRHVSLASLPGAHDRTITLSGFSKTYNMTGWRLGYAVGPEPVIEKMGLISDLIYICAPVPLQHGVAEAFSMDDSYFDEMLSSYAAKRELMCTTLEDIGFGVPWPEGSYYVFADVSPMRERFDGFGDDMTAAATLVERAGVGTVAGRSFYGRDEDGRDFLRFCFAKKMPELEEACTRLRKAFSG